MELRRYARIAALLGVAPITLSAQGAPEGSRWQLDAPAEHVGRKDDFTAGTFSFVSMAPGWHVTMGPGGLLFDPRNVIRGRFTLQSRIALFPGEGNAEYGVFVGGTALESAAATWTAFVVRRDGSAAVLRHGGGRTAELVPWTKRAAVKEGAAANVVRVSLDTAVHFAVNDSVIVTLPRDKVAPEGVFGFRIGSALNMHITTLDVTHRLAPVPSPR
jgi:hypothetical protein